MDKLFSRYHNLLYLKCMNIALGKQKSESLILLHDRDKSGHGDEWWDKLHVIYEWFVSVRIMLLSISRLQVTKACLKCISVLRL